MQRLPRCFEFETTHRRRPLCPKPTDYVANINHLTISNGSYPIIGDWSKSNYSPISEENIIISQAQHYVSNCNLTWLRDHLDMSIRYENETMWSHAKLRDLCTPLKIKRQEEVDVLESKTSIYPLINFPEDECHCNKDYYNTSENPICYCKETNETCSIFEEVPKLFLKDMRKNEYYISVSSSI